MSTKNRNTFSPASLCAAAALLLAPALSLAQVDNGECSGGLCGTPTQTGGGGCGCGCSILINQTDQGDTYQFSDDYDNDGWEDDYDNCPFKANAEQTDSDGDAVGDVCDNCPNAANPSQSNADGDPQGDACDSDADGDGIDNTLDNCPFFPNPGQADADGDGKGDLCDEDDDNDGVPDNVDNCPLVPNAAQDPADPTRLGAACKSDSDGDGIPDSFDNCPNTASLDVSDTDHDGMGDVCDADLDNDGVANAVDNCRTTPNPTQADADRDGKGDACDDKFCFTVDSDAPGRCLDPQAPYFTRPGADVTAKTGERVRLRLFSNRAQTAIRYTWAMDHSPNGNRGWVIQNPRGSVTNSSPWEYRYTAERTPWFTATEPGDYTIRLESALVFEDALGFPKTTDVQTLHIKVTGSAKLGLPGFANCSEAGAAAPALGTLALLGLLLRRKK